MTNFDYLKKDDRFSSFVDAAIVAEKVLKIDATTAVVNIRRAAEFAVKWMYTVDEALVMPYQDKFVTLINTDEFKDIVGDTMFKRIDFIRRAGNIAAHTGKKIKYESAELALKHLFKFFDYIAYSYGALDDYEEKEFDVSLLEKQQKEEKIPEVNPMDFKKLQEENEKLKDQLTARREERQNTYKDDPSDISEFKTRKIYIDTMLIDAGWQEGKDWINEYELSGMPNKSKVGFADYVLFGSDGKALAVIEAKKTCKDVAIGRHQADLYADLLEKKFGRRPIIFLTNGFDTRIVTEKYPEHSVSMIYSKRDLEKEFNKYTMRTRLDNIQINNDISNRYYQKEAVKAVCEAFDKRAQRKALLVMATGSGKTRTVISIVDVLVKHGWVKNVLFLADRNSLVTQAKRAFVNLLPNLSVTNLCEEKDNITARVVFSTYQTMMNCIDDTKDEDGNKLFTCGHFDLIICDEAHRSIYNKYKDIFNYFDAHLVGLTATPRDEIDKNTYDIFGLENKIPTYGYELKQAVDDEFLVDFVSLQTKLKFMENGIVYDQLSPEDQKEYEDLFDTDEEDMPESISSSALYKWIFSKDTIREVLNILMQDGIKVDYGSKIGKTIIFAKNHKHAEEIHKVWGEEFPEYGPDFCRVIDNQVNYAQHLIDSFSDSKKMPQIVVSVDMMDTGIDVPEVVNLVFFKKIMSKSKFWQMIGRGTRLCPGLLDGKDKEQFYIFDFCNNFEFFSMFPNGKEAKEVVSVQERIFNLKAEIAMKLQDIEYQTDVLIQYRKEIVQDMMEKIQELNRENFAVRQHLKAVDTYVRTEAYQALLYENIVELKEEVAPLISPYKDDVSAVRFDALMYGIELAYLVGKKYNKARREAMAKIRAISTVATIPEIAKEKEFIEMVLQTDYLENAGINEFEIIRERLRDLMKYIPKAIIPTIEINFDDEVLSSEWVESDLENDDLENYKKKVDFYIRKHQDNIVISKLKLNKQLSKNDIEALEEILWSELGTQEDYQKEYGDKPLGELVREIVGLDMNAAKEAFSAYLDEVNMTSKQIHFVNHIVSYIVKNGMMKDFSVLQDAPFNNEGDVVDIFDDVSVWSGIMSVIKGINKNADVA